MYVSLLPRVVLLPVIISVAPCATAQPAPSGPPAIEVITAVAQAEAQLEHDDVSLWSAQQQLHTCTTNYCISSQSIAFQTPPGWPAVPVETCCQTHWGALPDGIDWNNGAPVMICTSRAEYVTTFPNCGDPKNLSQAVPLDYERPKFAIGVAWPNPKQSRYEMQSIPIVDGSDGTCVKYSSRSGQVTNRWVHELKEPKRGTYVFSAAVSFQKGEKGYYAVLSGCQLKPPPSAPAE